ncbi:unnamed protein product [Parajaminaea phylloscopi]
MLAHSPKATDLAAYARPASPGTPLQASAVASSSAHPYPDDSDFIESDAECEEGYEDEELPSSGSTNKLVLSGTDAIEPVGGAGLELPEIPLIFVSDRLYFTYFKTPPPASLLNRKNGVGAAWFETGKSGRQAYDSGQSEDVPERFHWFNVDEELVYLAFYEDWGPLNVALFYRFCMHVHQLLNDDALGGHALVFYTSSHPHRKANASLLAALYSMIIDRIEPADAFHPFSQVEFKPFRDAGYGRADFCLTIQDILYGVHRAIKEQLLDLSEFNLEEYEYYEQVQCGDWNWITPYFLAFASPNDREYVASLKTAGGKSGQEGARLGRKLPQVFLNTVKYFKERNVKLVVRLNNPLYDKKVFEEAGIAHLDLYFDDGSNPSEEILREFIRRADQVIRAGGAVAVHCKAGLGRTGVLIGAYLIWRYGFRASEAIGFMRIMRPGCVVGPQQHFMYQQFVDWVRWGVHDSAMATAQKAIEAERQKLLSSSPHLHRRSRKRASSHSESEDIDEDDGTDATGGPPVTPKVRKLTPVAPATAAPAIKPVPCVGQPRKSPSPSRKRPAIAVAAPVPPQGLDGGSKIKREVLKASNSVNVNDLPRSASDENLRSMSLKQAESAKSSSAAPQTLAGVASLRDSWEAIAGVVPSATPPRTQRSVEEPRTTANEAISTPRSGRVLTEAQRLSNLTPTQCGTPSHTRSRSAASPPSAPGTPSLRNTVNATESRPARTAESTTTPSHSPKEDEDDVFGSSPQPGTPSGGKSRVPSFKASPHVRAAYNLKDTKLPHPRSPRSELEAPNAEVILSRDSAPAGNAASLTAESLDSQNSISSQSAAGSLAQRETATRYVHREGHRPLGRVPSSSTSISPAKVNGTRPTSSAARARVPTPSARLLASSALSSAPRTASNGSAGSGSSAHAVGNVNATSATRPATSRTVQARTASSSAKGLPSTHSARSAPRSAGQPAASMNRTTPISNSANAAMLAARANLKRARPSPDVPQTKFAGAMAQPGSRPPVALSATMTANTTTVPHLGRNVRRRRSSLGAADIGLA